VRNGFTAIKPYRETKMAFTQKEEYIYAFYLPDETYFCIDIF
jgi:hypothetical protein